MYSKKSFVGQNVMDDLGITLADLADLADLDEFL
jgi:hypothetical protein